jgi:AP2-associated kinase
MNMHDIFSKVSNTTQGITSSIKREAQNLYAQYQQNQNQNMNGNNNMNNNMRNMNGNGNPSNMNNNNIGMGENPFLQAAAPPGTIPPGTYVTVGKYQVMIERHLAEGGFAHVYVVQNQSGKKAVLKQIIVPDQEQVLTFQKEIKFMKIVSGHENVVQFFDSQVRSRSKSEGEGYEVLILMEYCSEGHVVDLMNSRLKVRLTENEILNIFYSVCKAVAHLHYQNPPIVHRDIKVENVLITSDGKYKLCDFGSATTEIIPPNKSLNIQEIRNLEEDIQKYTTIQYRPPEMCDLYQRKGLNEKVDIWALGVLLYKLCYYTTPFEDGNTLAIINGSYTKPQTPVYSNNIHHLIDIMLVVEPSVRANIYDVLSYLSSVLNVPCPITNKYTFSEQSAKSTNNNSNSPFFTASATNSVLTSVKQPVVTVPIVQNPNPTPMRRGRPNQKERKSYNNHSSNTNVSVGNKLSSFSYNSQQMQQSTDDPFKPSVTINSPNSGHHLSPQALNSAFGGSPKKPTQNSNTNAAAGSFFTKYSQDNKDQKNSDTFKSSIPNIKNQLSGSNEVNVADQSMLDNIFGKSTNNIFDDVSKDKNNDINVFDDNWVVDSSENTFDKLSEKRTLNDNFNNKNDFFSSTNDVFSNESGNNSNSKKMPRPPSFTKLAEQSAELNNQNHISKGSSSFSKYKSDPFLLSNTSKYNIYNNLRN